jgi:acetoin utilization deacetylase AcuC-like enzyme
MKAFWDPIQSAHAPQFFLQRGLVRKNFEIPARADALLAAAREIGMVVTVPPEADRAALEAVHPAAYLDFLRDGPAAWAALPEHGAEMVPNIHPTPEMLANGARPSGTIIGQVGWFTADTSCPIAAETWPASLAAASGAVAAADEAAAGRSAYALARPPGHHAYAARAGGHCYLNNAALAAERLLAKGAARVAVLDIDSHHGNGTQGIFWERDDVVFVSLHGDPNGYYPWYVGHADERGGGRGLGFNLNLPQKRGADDRAWLDSLDDGLQLIRHLRVDALVLSLGFDASRDEPLGFLAVSEEGFARAGSAIGALRLPTAIVQEGGYNCDVIGALLRAFIEAFRARAV